MGLLFRISEPTDLKKIKMTFWRAAGLNYIQYSAIAARVVRQALKTDLKADAAKRDITGIKFVKWENGKPVGKCLFYFFIFVKSVDIILQHMYLKKLGKKE